MDSEKEQDILVSPDSSVDNSPPGNLHVAMRMDATLGQFPIALVGEVSSSELRLAGQWLAEDEEGVDLVNWINNVLPENTLPQLFYFPVIVYGFSVDYRKLNNKVGFSSALKITPLGAMKATLRLDDSDYLFEFSPNLDIHFNKLPLIDKFLQDNSGFYLENFGVGIKSDNIRFDTRIKLTLGDYSKNIDIHFSKLREVLPDKVVNRFAKDNTQDRDGENKNTNVAITPSGNMPSVFWADVTKRLGAFNLNRIGIGMEDSGIGLYLDAGFTLGPLALDFYELKITIPLHDIHDFRIGLSGLAVSMQKPPLILSGGLYRDRSQQGMVYNGQLIVGCARLRLTALASYGVVKRDNKPDMHSMFIYAVLHANIGGPPFLFITGLAAGLGINRAIMLPAKVEDVKNFPFVAAATGSKSVSFTQLKNDISIEDGQYFACAGLRFTSFGMLDSFVLLNIEFGNRTRFSALGLSTLSIPPMQPDDKCIARAALAVKAVFSPDDGILTIMGVLSNDSFVLDKKCKLTGGFAIYAWGKGDYAGDFVVTFGGYHPSFVRPAHYPVVPPLGINWNITSNLSLRGSVYFTLTPSAVMAGGQLALNYQSGNLKAWLTAYAHFLMQWKPFFYDIRLGISVGASYTVNFLFFKGTLRVELGADLHIWGPDFRGTARISWFIISFTISFGDQRPLSLPALSWDEFKHNFLSIADKGLAAIQVSSGLVNPGLGSSQQKSQPILVKPGDLSLTLSSQLALTSIALNKTLVASEPNAAIRPMKRGSYTAVMQVSVEGESHSDWRATAYRENAPAALWGEPLDNNLPTLNGNSTVAVLKGCTLTPPQTHAVGHIPCIKGAEGSYSLAVLTRNEEITCGMWAWSSAAYPANKDDTPEQGEDPGLMKVLASLADETVNARRQRITSVLLPGLLTAITVNQHENALLFANPIICTTGYRPGLEATDV